MNMETLALLVGLAAVFFFLLSFQFPSNSCDWWYVLITVIKSLLNKYIF